MGDRALRDAWSEEGAHRRTAALQLARGPERCLLPGQGRGYDARKTITGRGRHLLIDTLGLIPAVVIAAASVQDRDEERKVLEQVPEAHYPEPLTIFADAGYQGRGGLKG